MDLIGNRPFFLPFEGMKIEVKSNLHCLKYPFCVFFPFYFFPLSSKWRLCSAGKMWFRWIGDLFLVAMLAQGESSFKKKKISINICNIFKKKKLRWFPTVITKGFLWSYWLVTEWGLHRFHHQLCKWYVFMLLIVSLINGKEQVIFLYCIAMIFLFMYH